MAAIDELRAASFRGVPFEALTAEDEVGHRHVRFEFPLRNTPEHEALGAHEGPIQLTALIVGDDATARLRSLQAALKQPGPGRLVHPWLGEMQAVVSGASPARSTLSQREGRVARIEITFERWFAPSSQPTDTIAAVLSSVDRALVSVTSVAAPVLDLAGAGSAVVTAVEGWLGGISDVFGAELARRGSAYSGLAAVSLAALGLSAVVSPAPADRIRAVGAAVVAGVTPAPVSAIGAGRRAVVAAAPPPAAPAVEALQAVVGALGAGASGLAPAQQPGTDRHRDAIVLLAVVTAAVGAAAASLRIDHESREAALAVRDRLATALETAADVAAGTDLDGVEQAWGALIDLRSSAITDLTERAGRLPRVRLWTPAGSPPALLVAQRWYGERPADLAAWVEDIVRRNRVRHPGALAAGTALELLEPRAREVRR